MAQKTVVMPGPDGVFVPQLNVDGLEEQADVIVPAILIIDDETTITP